MELLTNTVDWGNPVNWNHPLNRGLVSWWLAVPGRQGFGSNVWRDLCRRNDGTLTNMDPATDWVGSGYAGAVGALQLDGTNDLVAVPDHASLRPQTGDMSWLITVTNQAATSTNNDDLLADRPLGAVGAAQGMYLGKGGASTSRLLSAYIEASDGSNKNYVYNNRFDVGETAQLLMTLSNSQNRLRVFKNGQLLSVDTASNDDNITGKTFNSTQIFTICGRPGTTDRCWPCKVYEVRIWNREVQPTEAAAYYDLSRRRHPGLLNRIWTPRVSVQEAAAAAQRRYRTLMGVGV